MILCWRRHGKAGGCRIPLKTIRWMRFEIERTHRNGWTICDEDVLTYTSREVLFHITGFYQWFISSSLSRLWMTDKLQSSMYLENCILKIWYKVQTERFETNIKTSEVLHESVTKQTKNKQLLIVNTISQRCNAMHLRNGKHPCEVQAVISKSLAAFLDNICFANAWKFRNKPLWKQASNGLIPKFTAAFISIWLS